MDIYWYLVPKDGPYPWTPKGVRKVDFDYFKQMAGAIDSLGYTGALVATGGIDHDAWVIASSLVPVTTQMKFIVAVRPGIIAPAMMAQISATFDQFSQGRLLVNIITGENPQFPPYGINIDHDARYQMADEYWAVWRRLMQGETVSFKGQHVSLENARLLIQPYQKPHPPLFFSGSSTAAIEVAANHADMYLSWGETPALVADKIAHVKRVAAARGRNMRFGVRLNVIVRETKEEAWAQAQWLLDRMDVEAVQKMTARVQASDSVGQQRMNTLLGSRQIKHARDLEVYPDIWAGFGLIRNGPGTAIVGDADTVAARLLEYRDVGFDTFILSNYPLLEEAYRVAELLFPRLGFENSKERRRLATFDAREVA
jgi:alkanesulfonate monooxygenase